jgi:hypothetical protein
MRSALIQAYYRREGIDAMAVWRSYEDCQQMTPEKFRGYCEGLFLRVLEFPRVNVSTIAASGARHIPTLISRCASVRLWITTPP